MWRRFRQRSFLDRDDSLKEFFVAKKKAKKTTRKQDNAVVRYYRETVGELRKVSWPTRQEATNLTSITLVVIVVMSAFFGSLDYIFNQLFAFIFTY
jgi:preprotein translocase subunit SecE